jgi:hypothetical protein
MPSFTVIQNKLLDIKVMQKDRAATMPGYRLVTFDEMEIDPPAKQFSPSSTSRLSPLKIFRSKNPDD